eukprot:4541906-Amphidinium_carterae.1
MEVKVFEYLDFSVFLKFVVASLCQHQDFELETELVTLATFEAQSKPAFIASARQLRPMQSGSNALGFSPERT